MFNPYFQQPYFGGYSPTQQSQIKQQIPDERIWVQGEVGARAYLVAPGCTVPLWDSESQTIYLKSVNAAGIPATQKLVYSVDQFPASPGSKPTQATPGEYITREEFEKRISEIMKTEDRANE